MTDVIIVGGGPAGATLGCYLSMAGISNRILEKASHPRPHVGESMVTATTRIFQEIQLLETMEREGFPKKYGASWHPREGLAEVAIWFREFPQEGVDQEYTYHVDRGRFDHLLIERAAELGSEVVQNAHVKEVLFEGERASGVRARIAGEEVDLPAKIVVDASGRDAILGRQLGIKQNDPIFDQFAVHAWFEGVNRGEGETRDFIHIYFLPVDRGWAWQIPITDTITSIGVVAERADFRRSKGDVEAYFDQHIRSNPSLELAMNSAVRVNDLKQEGNYSYSLERFCGDGYLILGDAGRFVDPIFSSGVSVAMHSAKFASESIVAALESGDVSKAVFQPYEDRLRSGVAIWYEFIKLYYRCLPVFTRFIEHPQYRLQVLQLLQGDVYDRANAPVLAKMKEFVESVEANPKHSLHGSLQRLEAK